MGGLRRRPLGFVYLAVHPAWAPVAAARFDDLVTAHFYDGTKFYRVRSLPRPLSLASGVSSSPPLPFFFASSLTLGFLGRWPMYRTRGDSRGSRRPVRVATSSTGRA